MELHFWLAAQHSVKRMSCSPPACGVSFVGVPLGSPGLMNSISDSGMGKAVDRSGI